MEALENSATRNKTWRDEFRARDLPYTFCIETTENLLTKTLHSIVRTAAERLKSSSDSPALDAEVLLCFVLQRNRSFLRTWPQQQLTTTQLRQFKTLLDKRCCGFPIAYITGTREFWSREFCISPDVLIPRPETELLIEICLDIAPKHASLKVIDLGTGSGIIAITLAAERPAWKITASDISPKALALAQQNADRLKVINITFKNSHWFDNISDLGFDLVVSNPPYIAENDPHLNEGDLRFEPVGALVSGNHGLKDIENLVRFARRYLKTNGHLLIEHGYTQQDLVQSIFKHYNYSHIKTHLDLSGHPRVTSGQWR